MILWRELGGKWQRKAVPIARTVEEQIADKEQELATGRLSSRTRGQVEREIVKLRLILEVRRALDNPSAKE